jgi:cell shape-determining protein MreD
MKSFLAVGGMVMVAIACVVALAYAMADPPDPNTDWVPVWLALVGFGMMYGAVTRD